MDHESQKQLYYMLIFVTEERNIYEKGRVMVANSLHHKRDWTCTCMQHLKCTLMISSSGHLH